MSLPTFPNLCPPIKQEDALNMILTSIAMEEVGLSHIINAEGEKLQYALKYLKCKEPCGDHVDKLLDVNDSIKATLDTVMSNQVVLKSKMENVLDYLKKTKMYEKHNNFNIYSFKGCKNYIWEKSELLQLSQTCSSDCSNSNLVLSPDCKKIILKCKKCYTLNLSIDLLPLEIDKKSITIAIQTKSQNKMENIFIYNAPIISKENFGSVSIGGISIPTHNHLSCVELMFRLISPESAKIRKAFVSLTES